MREKVKSKFLFGLYSLTVAAPTCHPNLCKKQEGSISPTAAQKADLYGLLVADSEGPTGTIMSSSGWTCWTEHK